VKHPLLLIAGGLALLSGAALVATIPFELADPQSGWFAALFTVGWAVIDLAIARFLLLSTGADRGRVVGLSVGAIAGAFILAAWLGLMQLENGLGTPNWGLPTIESVLFFGAFVGNALVVLFVVLELVFGRRRGQKTSISGA
jgi:hypothetical protein